jgi:hypothetical protein
MSALRVDTENRDSSVSLLAHCCEAHPCPLVMFTFIRACGVCCKFMIFSISFHASQRRTLSYKQTRPLVCDGDHRWSRPSHAVPAYLLWPRTKEMANPPHQLCLPHCRGSGSCGRSRSGGETGSGRHTGQRFVGSPCPAAPEAPTNHLLRVAGPTDMKYVLRKLPVWQILCHAESDEPLERHRPPRPAPS